MTGKELALAQQRAGRLYDKARQLREWLQDMDLPGQREAIATETSAWFAFRDADAALEAHYRRFRDDHRALSDRIAERVEEAMADEENTGAAAFDLPMHMAD